MKKKLILTLIITAAFIFNLNAQVGIETESVGDGVILGFPENANKGILLPRITDVNEVAKVPGTFIFGNNKVLLYGSNKWIDMTKENSNNLEPYNYQERADAKGMLIEDGTGDQQTPDGVLVLDSKTKALALPVVTDATKLPSPKAGMICYDKKSKSLAIFNGTVWSFWN